MPSASTQCLFILWARRDRAVNKALQLGVFIEPHCDSHPALARFEHIVSGAAGGSFPPGTSDRRSKFLPRANLTR